MLSFFDSPIEFCDTHRKFVRLDQLQRSCARREGCECGQVCPLDRLFRRSRCRCAQEPAFAGAELGYE